MSITPRVRVTGALALVLAGAAAACVPDPGTPTTTTTTSTTTTTTSTTTTSTTTTSTTTTTTTIYEAPEAGAASSYQVDPAHTGAATYPSMNVATMTKKWEVTLPGAASYAVIARGKVFATAKTNLADYGTTLHAYDASTGTEVWSAPLAGTYWSSSIAYGAGTVVAVNYNGMMTAFDADSGAIRWQQQMPIQRSFTAPITIVGNVVYATGSGSGGTMFAVRLDTGGVKWTRSIGSGTKSGPAVDPSGIFVSHPCNTHRVDFAGAIVWTLPAACSGGGGKNVALDSANKRLYVRQVNSSTGLTNGILDSDTGAVVATTGGGSNYALWGGYAFNVLNGVLVKTDPATGQQVWSMGGNPGDTLVGAPVILNGTVLVAGSNGATYGLATSNGARVWTSSTSAKASPIDEQNVTKPPTGWNIGGGLVTVSTETGLAVFGN